MTKTHYIVSMLFVALVSASATAIGQSGAAETSREPPKGNCVTSFDYDKLSPQERENLFPESK